MLWKLYYVFSKYRIRTFEAQDKINQKKNVNIWKSLFCIYIYKKIEKNVRKILFYQLKCILQYTCLKYIINIRDDGSTRKVIIDRWRKITRKRRFLLDFAFTWLVILSNVVGMRWRWCFSTLTPDKSRRRV